MGMENPFQLSYRLVVLLCAFALSIGLGRAGTVEEDFRDARWMWPQALGQVTNTTVEFRQRFVAEGPVRARLAIAADMVYRVELNGRFVHTGRFPDVPPQRYYDVLPLDGVRAGENELRVSVYVQGINTFQTIPGDPGLMYALTGKGLSVVSGTACVWRISAQDMRENVDLVTDQLGFSFEYDAGRPDEAWRRLDAADVRRGPVDFELSERPVARVEILPECPSRRVAQGRLDGSPVPARVAPGMDATKMTSVAAAEFFADDGRSVRPEHFQTGFYAIVDLGREEAGFLSLDIDTDAGVVIDIGHAEHWENGRIRTKISERNFAGRYRARAGRQSYCRWARRMAGRYLQIHVRGVKTHFTLHGLSLKPALFPVVERPAPAGLSADQKRIWDTSVRTLRLCMHEHYEDCPWREQALYGNDARNQMLCGYYAFDESNRMPELALQIHARGLEENGWLEMCMPARINTMIPSFTFCWVLAVGDNYRYRRNVTFTKSLMPVVRQILDMRLAELEDGLLPCPKGRRHWQFYEWAKDLQGYGNGGRIKVEKSLFESPLNLFFVLALDAGAACADATGDPAAANRWRAAAQTVRREVCRKFWNPERRQFETALGRVAQAGELVQALALLADIVPPEAKADVVRKLSGPSDWTEITLSQTIYKYEALIAAGGKAARAAVRLMDADWKKMLDAGATSFWEMREGWPAFSDAGSLCHGWSAIPVYIYGKYPHLAKDVGIRLKDPDASKED